MPTQPSTRLVLAFIPVPVGHVPMWFFRGQG
jgi:hypothetical protein